MGETQMAEAIKAAQLREYQDGLAEGVKMTLRLLCGDNLDYPGAAVTPQEFVTPEVRKWAEGALDRA